MKKDQELLEFGNWLFQNKNSLKIFEKAGLDESYIRLPMVDILAIFRKEKQEKFNTMVLRESRRGQSINTRELK